MPLSKKANAGDWVRDFKKSKAPQFKNKSNEKKREMAIAAFLDTQREDVSFDHLRDQCIEEGIGNIKSKIRDIKVQPKELQEEAPTMHAPISQKKLRELGDKSYNIYRNEIKPREEKEEEKPCTIASRADVKARMNELIKSRNGGDAGRTSPTTSNGSGNVSNSGGSRNVGLYPTSLTIEDYEHYIKDLFKEAVTPSQTFNTTTINSNLPKVMEEVSSPLSSAIEQLEEELLQLEDGSWQSIDKLMRSICKEHNITPKELHKEFKKTHGMIPDDWLKEQRQVNETCGWFPLDEVVRLNQVGMVYDVTFIFRGVTQRLKFFWPEINRPTKVTMQKAVEKLYPTAKLILFYPSMDQGKNTMVLLSPMREFYDPLQMDEWGMMSPEATMVYEEICTEEGNPLTPPYVVDENVYEVVVEDYDTGEVKTIQFEETGEPGSGKHFCFKELYTPKAPLKSAKTVGQIAKKHNVDADKIRHQLRLGQEVEKEHTTDKGSSDERQIALQHLDELPNYYTKLKKMEEAKADDNGFTSCWDGYKKKGMKNKGDKLVNNCVKEEGPNLSVGRGEKQSVEAGGGLTAKGRAKYNRETGSNLKPPVTSKNPGPKDAARRKSFCARSRSWDGERGLAARRRWKCN